MTTSLAFKWVLLVSRFGCDMYACIPRCVYIYICRCAHIMKTINIMNIVINMHNDNIYIYMYTYVYVLLCILYTCVLMYSIDSDPNINSKHGSTLVCFVVAGPPTSNAGDSVMSSLPNLKLY